MGKYTSLTSRAISLVLPKTRSLAIIVTDSDVDILTTANISTAVRGKKEYTW